MPNSTTRSWIFALKELKMAAKKKEAQMKICPVGQFFMDLDKVFGKKSDFGKHLTRSRIEFLRAIRSLVDERIASLEKKKSGRAGKRCKK